MTYFSATLETSAGEVAPRLRELRDNARPAGPDGAPAGHEQTFLELFQRHGDSLHRFCRSALHRREDAEDVVQETFLKLLKHLQSGGEQTNLRSWLFTVAANGCRDRHRSWRRWLPWEPSYVGLAAAADAQLEARLREDAVTRAFARLSPRDRLLLALRAEGLSYKAMAGAVRVRPASVGQLLARALHRWQRAYAEVGGSDACGTA